MSVYQDNLDDDTIAQRIALWSEVNREDREKLEKMQVALGSAMRPRDHWQGMTMKERSAISKYG